MTGKELRRGEIIDLDGLRLVMATEGGAEALIGPGDLYIAERNTGPQLLTCSYVNTEHGYVVPSAGEYPFNFSECVKVREAGL